MKQYHKIETVFNRDIEGTKKLIEGDFRSETLEYLKDCSFVWTEKVDGCVSSDTKLCLADGGYITISEVVDKKLEVEILGYHDGDIVRSRVVGWHKNGITNDWYQIRISRRGLGTKGNSYKTIRCTGNHKFYSNGEYIRADELKVGMNLTLIAQSEIETVNNIVAAEIIDIIKEDTPKMRYDITTETHNYFANNILVHNCNIRVNWDGHSVTIGGRTDKAQLPADLVNFLTEKFCTNEAEELFEQKFGENEVTLYGEGYGKKIQGVGSLYIPDGVSFIMFDVMIGNVWLKREDVEDIAKCFDVDVVPIVGEGTIAEAVEYVKSHEKSTISEKAPMEGIVCRPKVELLDRRGNRVIVKIKARDFLG